MRITKEEFKRLSEYQPLPQAVANLKAITEKHGVSFTTNMAQIKSEFKAQLFTQLLAVDKGLKARYGMARTDDAKRKLLDAEILSLDGFDEVDELQLAVNEYLNQYSKLENSAEFYKYLDSVQLTPETFLTEFEGCLLKTFFARVVNISETPEYKAVEAIREGVEQLFKLNLLTPYCISNNSVWPKLDAIIKLPVFDIHNGKIQIDEISLNEFLENK